MINNENYLGKISVSDAYLKELVCRTAANCFGVAGMKSGSFREFILNDILGIKPRNTGVFISEKNNQLTVDLHVCIAYGTNITAIMKSIENKVRFALKEYAGADSCTVNVYVDNIRS